MSASKTYDVVVAGGGIVGAAMALILAKQSVADSACGDQAANPSVPSGGNRRLNIALVEQKAPDQSGPSVDADVRVVAINEASRTLLEELRVWRGEVASRACSYTHMQVRDSEGTGCIEFDCTEVQRDSLGYIVPNALVVDGLFAEIATQGNIDLYRPDRIARLTMRDSEKLSLQLANSSIMTSLLIAADGASSQVRARSGFRVREWDYGHSAIVATLKVERNHANTAWQWFAPAGPLAFLPLCSAADGEHYVSIVWSLREPECERLMAMNQVDFCSALSRASEHCLGALELVSQRYSFPLRQCHAVDYVKTRIALIGDAAHTIHPLAGQGVNLGLADVGALNEAVRRALSRGEDPGELASLQRYQRRRQPENLAAMALMEGFKRLFEREELPLRFLRSAGMNSLNALAPMKLVIMRQAMGLT